MSTHVASRAGALTGEEWALPSSRGGSVSITCSMLRIKAPMWSSPRPWILPITISLPGDQTPKLRQRRHIWRSPATPSAEVGLRAIAEKDGSGSVLDDRDEGLGGGSG